MRLKIGDLIEHEGDRGYVQTLSDKEAIVWTRKGHLKIFNIYGTYIRTHTKRGKSGKIRKNQ